MQIMKPRCLRFSFHTDLQTKCCHLRQFDTVEAWEWICIYFIPHFTARVITYLCWN